MPAPRPERLCRDVFFEFLTAQGIPFIFGNPGTTEERAVLGSQVALTSSTQIIDVTQESPVVYGAGPGRLDRHPRHQAA